MTIKTTPRPSMEQLLTIWMLFQRTTPVPRAWFSSWTQRLPCVGGYPSWARPRQLTNVFSSCLRTPRCTPATLTSHPMETWSRWPLQAFLYNGSSGFSVKYQAWIHLATNRESVKAFMHLLFQNIKECSLRFYAWCTSMHFNCIRKIWSFIFKVVDRSAAFFGWHRNSLVKNPSFAT